MQERPTPAIYPHNALSTHSQECKEEELDSSLIYLDFGSISSSERGGFSVDKRNGIWTLLESEKYKNFLKRYRTIFLDHRLRRCNQIFVKMAKRMKSRGPLQCRSHHQKMLKKHHTIDQIISHFQDKLENIKNEHAYGRSQQLAIFDKKQDFYSMGTICNKIRIIIKEEYVRCYHLGG